MLRRQLGYLGPADRQLLHAAAVQGTEFDSAVIARIVARDASEVETRLRRLDEVYGLVYQLREERLADGRPSVRYRFVHTLCRDALWASLTPTRRDTLSGQVRHAVDVLRPGHRGDVSAPATHAEGAAARMRYGRPPGAGPRTGEVIIV